MMRLNAIMGADLVSTMKSIWARDQETHPSLASLNWPDYAGRNTAFRLAPETVGAEPLSLVPFNGAQVSSPSQ